MILLEILNQASHDCPEALASISITASGKELERIIQIGPERAGQIIQLRKERPVRNVDDLVRIKA